MLKRKSRVLIILGLTGGIATGKSTVASMLRELKIPVVCADGLAHALSQKGSPALKDVLKQFGKSVFNPDKSLNRPALAKIIFSDAKAQKKLQNILHPRIKQKLKSEVVRLKKQGHQLIVIDVPLLFEVGWDDLCDVTVCVTAPQKLQIERLKKSRGFTRSQALDWIKSQMPLKEKVKRADFVIENGSTVKSLRDRVIKLTRKLRAQPDSNR